MSNKFSNCFKLILWFRNGFPEWFLRKPNSAIWGVPQKLKYLHLQLYYMGPQASNFVQNQMKDFQLASLLMSVQITASNTFFLISCD